jgi:hypothetical protein
MEFLAGLQIINDFKIGVLIERVWTRFLNHVAMELCSIRLLAVIRAAAPLSIKMCNQMSA